MNQTTKKAEKKAGKPVKEKKKHFNYSLLIRNNIVNGLLYTQKQRYTA